MAESENPATPQPTVRSGRPGATPAQASGLGRRAISGPMRAVTRIFAPSGPGQATDAAPRTGRAVVDCGYYIAGERQPGDLDYAAALRDARERDDAFVWLGLHEPTHADLADIASVFELDEFAVEDAAKGGQRAKLEHYGTMTFLVVRTARYVEHANRTEASGSLGHPADRASVAESVGPDGEQRAPLSPVPGSKASSVRGARRQEPELELVQTGDLMMFVGEHFVITVRHGDVNPLAPIRADLERKPDLLQFGPWSVVYAILDRAVDAYIHVARQLEDDIDAAESQVFARHVHGRIARIYQLKREVVEFKRAVLPAQRPLALLMEGRPGTMPKKITRYFRDVHDHLVRTVEQVVSYDDLLNSILQARLAQVTVDQNNDMRKIASWAAIFAVQTAIAGIYGMNFKYMPELYWRYGYVFALVLMFGSAFGMYRGFRRSGWL